MATIIGVRFKNSGKLYYFDPGELWPAPGNFVIVETARGMEYGQVITGVREVSDDMITPPLKPILRIATDRDAKHAEVCCTLGSFKTRISEAVNDSCTANIQAYALILFV